MPDKTVNSEGCDELRVKGVKSRGYGMVAKAAMLDPALPVESKGILAFFCSYTGSGNNTAFPCRNTILKALHVNKDTYYKYLHVLVDNGYITIEQSKGAASRFTHNIYTIEDFPSRFDNKKLSAAEYPAFEKMAQTIYRTKDIYTSGYGFMPKLIAEDPETSLSAKALYAFFSVFSGAGLDASPSKDLILHYLNTGNTTYAKLIKQLTEKEYVTRISVTGPDGHYAGFKYLLTGSKNQISAISDTVKSDAVISDTVFSDPVMSDTEISDTATSDTVFSDTNTTSSNNNRKNNNKQISNQSNHAAHEERSAQETPAEMDSIDYKPPYESNILPVHPDAGCLGTHEDIVRRMCGYDTRMQALSDSEVKDKALLDLFVICLSEMLDGKFVYGGQQIPGSSIQELLQKNWISSSTNSDVPSMGMLPESVMTTYRNAERKQTIESPYAYMKPVIFSELKKPGRLLESMRSYGAYEDAARKDSKAEFSDSVRYLEALLRG